MEETENTTTSGSREKRLSQRALLWERKLTENNGQKKCGYWDVESLRPCAPQAKGSNSGSSISLLSYLDVFSIVSVLVHAIRCQIQDIFWKKAAASFGGSSHEIGVPVVVAIPEGPYLPLAVLAVHVLNIPFLIGQESTKRKAFAVLVPIEPGEGKDRIRHMIAETRATLVLSLPPDASRLEDIISALDPLDDPGAENAISDEGLYRADRPLLVDLAALIQQSIAQDPQASFSERVKESLLQNEDRNNWQQNLEKCSRILSDTEANDNTPETHYSNNRISHIVYTSGTTGKPKGCISSCRSLQQYLENKNQAHVIKSQSTVLLASALSFDPCLSDILATFQAGATLALASRRDLTANLPTVLQSLQVTHVLCTPTLWSTMNTSTTYQWTPTDFPCLKAVALGGEPIPKSIVQTWARRRRHRKQDDNHKRATDCRLFATYGVTEACVYQTMGELVLEKDAPSISLSGQDVGKAFEGLEVFIWPEEQSDTGQSADSVSDNNAVLGEVILSGCQLDKWSSYLNSPDLTRKKFIKDDKHDSERYFYKTGDRGCLDQRTGYLRILGRIAGEEGTVKINGIRVELGEIEAALVDDFRSWETAGEEDESWNIPVILDASVVVKDRAGEALEANRIKDVVAYCVLSSECAKEIKAVDRLRDNQGILCDLEPLSLLLQTRCTENVRAGCTPSAFVFVPRMPLTATGKRNRKALPSLQECVTLSQEEGQQLLREFGTCGAIVAEQLISCLNLQPCQQSMLTTSANFSMMGGDSLAATRIVRALYAHHHGVNNTRFLGGKFGNIEGPFSAAHLILSKSLGSYVEFLNNNGVCSAQTDFNFVSDIDAPKKESKCEVDNEILATNGENDHEFTNKEHQALSRLYDALLQATSLGYTSIALGLLDYTDPNWSDHGGRLGKVSGRNARKEKFRSGPLHLACLKGNIALVSKLVEKGAKITSPDASGTFPLHLAASGETANKEQHGEKEHERRLKCVKLLLDAGAPLTMKDGNKQTILHCAARAGNAKLVTYVMKLWKEVNKIRDSTRDSSIDWRDHWFRTPVHWSILNGHVDTLNVLLEFGCNPNPPKANVHKRSSVAVESPQELCERMYGKDTCMAMPCIATKIQKIQRQQQEGPEYICIKPVTFLVNLIFSRNSGK